MHVAETHALGPDPRCAAVLGKRIKESLKRVGARFKLELLSGVFDLLDRRRQQVVHDAANLNIRLGDARRVEIGA
ncbi:hypothetical protein MES5069_60048 [Mesorhizobium escarrei]|uniref:Uncharacterized protein n=1 Tax=Mesorhizobium escarrei TaxID=666018 RepID=A0ABM9EF37_9HYPH|nr:hypothetical protein MES5069_60048 [Mesorhizobium escarrei]